MPSTSRSSVARRFDPPRRPQQPPAGCRTQLTAQPFAFRREFPGHTLHVACIDRRRHGARQVLATPQGGFNETTATLAAAAGTTPSIRPRRHAALCGCASSSCRRSSTAAATQAHGRNARHMHKTLYNRLRGTGSASRATRACQPNRGTTASRGRTGALQLCDAPVGFGECRIRRDRVVVTEREHSPLRSPSARIEMRGMDHSTVPKIVVKETSSQQPSQSEATPCAARFRTDRRCTTGPRGRPQRSNGSPAAPALGRLRSRCRSRNAPEC